MLATPVPAAAGKTWFLTVAVLAPRAAPALAQSSRPATQPRVARQTGEPAAAVGQGEVVVARAKA